MIKLIKSTFYKEKDTKKELIKFIDKAEHLSFGVQCEKFEEDFAKWQKRKYCIFVNSGSSANLALIQSLLNLSRIKKSANMAFSSLTWSTNAMPLIELGVNPIPIDVELDTLNVSSKKLIDTIKKHELKALFLTNLLGFCDDIDRIAKICKEKNIILIEDNCEALGTVYRGKKLGNFGLASTYSFYVGHHMSTVEGGAICTNDKKLSDMLKLVRAHGWDRNLSLESQVQIRNRHKVNSTFYSRYTFYDLGYNLRPTEINGLLGNLQIKYLPEIIKKRNKNFLKLASILYKNLNYYPIKYNHIEFISNFAVPIICKSKKIRDEIVEKCKDKIEIRPIVGGDMVLQPFFKKYVSGFTGENINAKIIHEQGLYFGNNPELTGKEIKEIIKIFTA